MAVVPNRGRGRSSSRQPDGDAWPLGAYTAQLVPNVGASPAGTFYVVVFQLDGGTIRTEYWAVPTTSPTTVAAVLTTLGTGHGDLAVSEQYVDAAVPNVGFGSIRFQGGRHHD